MASYTKKGRKSDPSYKRNKSSAPDTQLSLQIGRATPVGAGTVGVVNGPRLLSMTQHRLYRQCGNYRLRIDVHDSGDVSPIRVVTLANTWYVKRAIQMARDRHDQAMADELQTTTKARWYDFRIAEVSGADPLLPVLGSSSTSTGATAIPYAGEWDDSVVYDQAGTQKKFKLEGASSLSTWNIFEEYDKMANTAADPQTGAPGGYDGIEASIDASNTQALQDRGNLPPYSTTDLLDQVFVTHPLLYRSGGNSRTSTGFIDAPLGLIWVQYAAEGQNPQMFLTAAAGDYKGVRMEAY